MSLPMLKTRTITQTIEVNPRIADLVRFALYLRSEGVDAAAVTQDVLIDHAERFWEAQHGEESHEGQGAALANVCGKKCDHGSECLLLKGHEPADRHETQHGCVFYDEEPAVRPHSVPGWWQVT